MGFEASWGSKSMEWSYNEMDKIVLNALYGSVITSSVWGYEHSWIAGMARILLLMV